MINFNSIMMMRLDCKKGYTIAEALIGLAILLLVWIAVLGMIFISKASESRARHKVQAIYVLHRAIEDLHRKPFASIASSASSVSIDTRGTPDDPSDDFTGTQTVTVSSPSAYYKKAVVTLTWNETLGGITKSAAECCGTYIANDPQAN